MTKYLLSRILRSLVSVVIVVAIVMIMIYSWLNRDLIFKADPQFSHVKSNAKEVYMMQQWEKFGYVDYIPYADWLMDLVKAGEIDEETYKVAVKFGNTADKDNETAAVYVERFRTEMEAKGYEYRRLEGDTMGKKQNKYHTGGEPRIFVCRDIPVLNRLWNYFTGLLDVDNIHYVEEDIQDRGLKFTLFDPAYGGEKFSPAIMGNGTYHKYLLYFDDQFPFIHQNLVTINLGKSYSINQGIDVFQTMTQSQGSFARSMVTYPSGAVEESADNIHSATYVAGSFANGTPVIKNCFVDDYTNVTVHKAGLSKMGYSFTLGIIATILSYLIAIPLGITMALKKLNLLPASVRSMPLKKMAMR